MKNLCGLLFFILMLLFFSACTPAYEGYGVLLWSENSNAYKNGEIIKIVSTSKLNESYEIAGKNDKTTNMIPWWRVEYFKSMKEAKKYAEQYKPYTNMYVYSTKEGIPPVREKIGNADSNKILYKFRENQVAKVLSRTEKKLVVGNLEDYWYQVLLQNDVPVGSGKYITIGIKGYCFGYYLQVTNSENGEDIDPDSLAGSGSNDLLERFFHGNWRPIGFQDMLDAGKINLDKFNPAWGIFPDRENKKITILLEKNQYIAEYKEILQVSSNIYTFPDSTLKIEILSPNRLSATFSINGNQLNFNFANIKQKLDDIIQNEKKRRDEIYEKFYSRGKVLSSSAYGSIELRENKEFTWTDFDKLIPFIIPKAINGQGTISFRYFLADSLAGKYDGVITLIFNEYTPPGGINFLYQFSENGVKLYYIDNSAIQDNEVSREGNNQVILFFNFEE